MSTILCIEDEPDIREAIAEELEDDGHNVLQAKNGKDGLDALLKQAPDLVLCDINMPVMDGHELLVCLRRDHPDLAEVPFIFLSANADRSQIVAGKKLGADDYLTKPVDFDVLTATVNSRLEQISRIRKKHEMQIIQTQKMEAIGRLTGGVAHEFNNLLTAIRGFSEIASLNVENTELVSSCLADAIDAADRAAGITAQLLAYSRKQANETKIIDANTAVSDAERLLQPLVKAECSLKVNLFSQPIHCATDQNQLFQVIMNLVINARDATGDDGVIDVSVGREEITEDKLLNFPEIVETGPYVRISVRDNGSGIDEATQSKMFEPFFTTKAEGQGTGLGLAVVYGIIRQSAGIIFCESEPGKGATFHVYLPEKQIETKAPCSDQINAA